MRQVGLRTFSISIPIAPKGCNVQFLDSITYQPIDTVDGGGGDGEAPQSHVYGVFEIISCVLRMRCDRFRGVFHQIGYLYSFFSAASVYVGLSWAFPAHETLVEEEDRGEEALSEGYKAEIGGEDEEKKV